MTVMPVQVKLNIFKEISVRVFLWSLFMYCIGLIRKVTYNYRSRLSDGLTSATLLLGKSNLRKCGCIDILLEKVTFRIHIYGY